MNRDLTQGGITKTILLFALPMTAGNLLQQFYNIADTWVVGHFLGKNPLAAVGSAYTLMTFLTSILIGLCMGSGALFSLLFGEKDFERLRRFIAQSFWMIGAVTLALCAAAFLWIDPVLSLLRVPAEVYGLLRGYLRVIFMGIPAVFLYNYFACLLRAVGDSLIPLVFLSISAVLNIALDLLFVAVWPMGVIGAAAATVIAQVISGIGILVYTLLRRPELRVSSRHMRPDIAALREIMRFSFLTCAQQSVMNFGILLVQGLVNTFGTDVMAAFAAAVKIDSFAYMPAQDFGNAFSTFIAQNYGAGEKERMRHGSRSALLCSSAFCLLVSGIVFLLAEPMMRLFVSEQETEVIRIGAQYLRIEGAFYIGIGILFLLYGYYRAVRKPGMSLVLTLISLGLRVALAYILAPIVGEIGIWISVPIGWAAADLAGFFYKGRKRFEKGRLSGGRS